jgi:hypothetical protein
MKKIILIFFVAIFYLPLQGQSSFFVVTKTGTKYTEAQLKESVEKADWCGYFNENSRYLLTFEDGSTVELFSKKELGEVTLNGVCFQNENTTDNGIYKIHKSGILIRMLSARNTSKN